MRFIKIILIITAIGIGTYFVGPHPSKPAFETALPSTPPIPQLDSFIANKEKQHKIKENNEARIIWANDSLKQKTNYAIVYLHGFSASQEEGNPVHRNIAKKFGCNLYLSRLAEHGIDTVDALINFTADKLWESAKEAYAIGKQLGDTVILMGTSTGCTVALQLAAAYPEVGGLILYSPNIAINDPNAHLLNNPWGLSIARMVKKSDYIVSDNQDPQHARYWNTQYCLEAAVELEELLETTMNKQTFEKVQQPLLTLYYYKDEKNQDPVVKVSAMKEMFAQVATPANKKRMVAVPNAGAHVLASPIVSKDIKTVEDQTALFLRDVFRLREL
ncbi:MAG: alpha/beta hydrolase [Chitinophagaceae bacterium]|nr:alpha/beta hydrolase [Chitinophagaceae bacterium]